MPVQRSSLETQFQELSGDKAIKFVVKVAARRRTIAPK
jgi:hypothetical protein